MNLLTVKELCKRLNCEPSYVYRLVHERRIPFLKLGHRKLRFDPVQIDAWIEERFQEAQPGIGFVEKKGFNGAHEPTK